jgi:very-short-patch-repair endonuclease
VQERGSNGFCSAECHAVYNAREKFREREQERRILEEKGPEQAKAFAYARWSQWSSLHPHYSEFYRTASPEYLKEYGRAYSIEYSRMKTRTRLGLPEDAPLPDKIPHTTELPIKLWLEENNIVFEIQKYIEVGGTFTLVDFFIPMTGSDTGICLYCDGDYWHGPEFPERQEGDKRQTKELEKLGYVVFRLWESDIERGIRPVEILELVKP